MQIEKKIIPARTLRIRSIILSNSYRKQESRAAFLFILPAFLLMSIFIFYPMMRALITSFYDLNLISLNSTFVGLKNYADLLHDKDFINSLKNTLYFAIVVIPLQTAIALGLALLIQKKFRGSGIFRSIFFLPFVVSFAVSSTVFRLIYNKDYGLVNVILHGLGLPKVDFLSDPHIAMIGIIIIGIWRAVGFYMVVFLAGLNNIPDDYYEAAKVDGASSWQCFYKITLPLLKRTMSFVVIITTMDALKLFVPVFITTSGGGPAGATSTVVYYIYNVAFEKMHMGFATAAAFLYFLVVLIISIIQLRLFKSDVEY